jgi:hypothetical protein
MRAITLSVLLIALALAVAASAATSAVPSVRFLGLIPAKVHGAHFVAGEQVKVTLKAGATMRVRTVRAAATGGFTVSFGMLAEKDRCSGSVAVTAIGARGDRAYYKLPSMVCPAMASGTN